MEYDYYLEQKYLSDLVNCTLADCAEKEVNMALPQKSPGNAHDKRNSWDRGKGSYSMRGELKHGIALRKRELNRKVRHSKRIKPTLKMVDFS